MFIPYNYHHHQCSNIRARWTTFLKARLNCSIPGDFPFYFNEIRKSQILLVNSLFSSCLFVWFDLVFVLFFQTKQKE